MHRAAWRLALVLCAAGALRAQAQPPPARRTRSLSADRWNNLISEYARAGGAGDAWFPRPIPVEMQLGGEGGPRGSVPLLVLPVPVPMPARSAAECAAPANAPSASAAVPVATKAAVPVATKAAAAALYGSSPDVNRRTTFDLASLLTRTFPTSSLLQQASPASPALPASARLLRTAPRFDPIENSKLLVEQFRAQVPTDPDLPPVLVQSNLNEEFEDEASEGEDEETAPATDPVRKVRAARLGDYDDSLPGHAAPGRRRRRCRRPARMRADLAGALAAADAGAGGDTPSSTRVARAAPPLRFERPLKLRAQLTVPRADYTEPYTVWWDPASGASRIDFHGGTASAYRLMRVDGLAQSVLLRLDRTGAETVRRCIASTPRRVALEERALPALPDLRRFFFDGYVPDSTGQLERWRYTLEGRAGELGGVRGEALTFRHELLVARDADNFTAIPVRYAVSVDSSVLGPNSDGYVHTYGEVTPVAHDPAMLRLDLEEACDFVERTERMERVEPLREFTLLRRDPRYDNALERYKVKFSRRYADDMEDAVRKNLLMQSYRFVDSGNRQGATFVLGITFLSDRLLVERRKLLGADPAAASGATALPFPYSPADLDALRNRLPRLYDWRERGAVTPVRNQWLCSSCWAFSVVGAVEGALAINTGRLVELSEQALVDCADTYGAFGCNGSWPSSAYNYVRERGLPARRDYPEYSASEQRCDAARTPTVTRISAYVNVTRKSVLALKAAIKRHGPTVVIIDGEAQSLASYTGGHYSDDRCRRNSPNHAVLAVGWTVYKQETYLILKNSWTTSWGEGGYMLMRAPGDTCGVLRRATYPVLRDQDVHSIPASARTLL